jgi:flagellar biosynthesis protein FlhG
MTTIIPVASGKGGVGKSLITANLSMALAELGYQVVAADLDFGGANLHSYLGLKNNNPGIGEFLMGRVPRLDDLLVNTSHQHVHFLPGEGTTPFLANMNVAQRIRLAQNLRKLPADFLLLDLSGGSANQTLDFFAMSPRSLLVSRADTPSLMNLLGFLKQLAFRRIEHFLPRNLELQNAVKQLLFQPINVKPAVTVQRIYQTIGEYDPNVARRVADRWTQLKPRVLCNQVGRPEDMNIWKQVQTLGQERLQLDLQCWAEFGFDEDVNEALRDQIPLFQSTYGDAFITQMLELADRIASEWTLPSPKQLANASLTR